MQILIDQRINKINAQSFYYTEQLKQLYIMFLIKLMQPKNKTKIKGSLVTGKPDAGKTTAVKQFKEVYMANVEHGKSSDLFYFKVPPRLHAKGVFHKFCEKLNIPDTPNNYKGYSTIHFVDKSARKLSDRFKGVFIDEMQNLFLLPSESRLEILELFNRLINEARIPIFLVGVEGVKDLLVNLESDLANLKGTFSSRFPEFKIKNFTEQDDSEFLQLLISIDKKLYLENSNGWYTDESIRQIIINYTDGLVGRIVELLRDSAINAIRQEVETITEEIIKQTAKELEYIG